MKHCFYSFTSFLVISFGTTIGYSQTTTLPPAAQEAINKGIMATKAPDYLLAARYFEEARKAAPQSPEVFFNLGLAESKIPGRELRAICWFGAYLTANPTAPNSAAVKEQIVALDMKSLSNLSRLIKVVDDVASQIPEDDQMPTMGRDKGQILSEVSILWAGIGDIAHAQKSAKLIKNYEMWKNAAYGAIFRAQLMAGDAAGAQKTVSHFQDKDQRSELQKEIAEYVAKTQPVSTSGVAVEDWLREMGIGTWKVGPLTADIFLDLEGYLKSLPPPSKSIYDYFWALQETAKKLVTAQNISKKMMNEMK